MERWYGCVRLSSRHNSSSLPLVLLHLTPHLKGPDALLTSMGSQQAREANKAWKSQLGYSIPLPQLFLSSPLSRAASTLELTWLDIVLTTPPFSKPIFLEGLRETIGLHTCDRRRSKSFLTKTFPNFTFDPTFAEEDELWGPVYQETFRQQVVRLKSVLDWIWGVGEEGISSTYVSISAHSGTIAAILENIGHRQFNLQTGAMIPVVVKGFYGKVWDSSLPMHFYIPI